MYGTLTYTRYEVLIGLHWHTVDPTKPVLAQVKGMRGYRMFGHTGDLVKASTIKPE